MEITLSEMELLIEKIKELREKETEASRIKKDISTELEMLENLMIQNLNSQGLSSYRGKQGTVSITHRTSVKKPETDEDKAAFHNWLREQGLYDSLISVNSQSLNALYKNKFAEALEQGNTDFSIPGISGVTIQESLSFRKG
jgi:hypothetical protein